MKVSEQNAYGSTWYSDTMVPAPVRPRLAFDLDVDVCVVGGGLAGLSTAREIARRGWSVAVLEARRVAWNASGRNCGFVIPGFAKGMDDIVKRVGLDDAKSLWRLSEAGVEYVRRTIGETGMPGVDPTDGWLKVSKADDAEEDLALIKLYGQEFGAEIEGWPTERVRAVLKTDHYFHGIHFPRAFTVHPLNYALGLAAAAEAAGARIFEDTPVVSIDPAGVRKRIVTPSARLRASHVVLAGNVHLGALQPQLAGTLMPLWTYTVVTAPLGAPLDRAIAYRGGITDTDKADNHYRIVDGNRLLWSGGMTTWETDPKWFVRKLRAGLQAVYPQLGDVEIERYWSGVMGYALHRMPQIGEFAPGMWVASGFGGHGLNTTAMAGSVVARAITEGDDTWRLFLPFDLVWAGGAMGRAVAQVSYWWFRRRERSDARAARKREREYRRSQAHGAPELEAEPEAPGTQPDAGAANVAESSPAAVPEDAVSR